MGLKNWALAALAALCVGTGCPQPPPPSPEVPKAALIKSFSASPALIPAGGETTLSWEVENATSVAISTQSGSKVDLEDSSARSGSVKVTASADTVYLLTAYAEGGIDTAAASVLMATEETRPLLTILPGQITAGESATLVWNAPGASSITITDDAGSTVYEGIESSGSVDVRPAFDTVYRMVIEGETFEATLTVNPAILHFAVTPNEGEVGDPVTVTWQAGGAEVVELSTPGRGIIATAATPQEIADGSFADVLEARPADGVIEYVLTAKRGNLTVTRTEIAYVGADPLLMTRIPENARTNDSFLVSWEARKATRVEVTVDGQVLYRATTPELVRMGSFNVPVGEDPVEVTIAAWNDRGGHAAASGTVVPIGVPIATQALTASPGIIAAGGDPLTLSWEIANARNLSVRDQDGRLVFQATGFDAEQFTSVVVYPNKQTVYTLEADNNLGDLLAPLTVTVDVTTPATVTFDPPTAPAGAIIQLTGTTVPNSGDVTVLGFAPTSSYTFHDIGVPANSLSLSCSTSCADLKTLSTPFHTTIAGQSITVTQIQVSPNGWFSLGDAPTDGPDGPANANLQDDLPAWSFAPLFGNLRRPTGKNIYALVDSVGGEQRLTVQFEAFQIESDSSTEATFQAQIFESGRVVFAYKDVVGFSSYPVRVGFVHGDGIVATQYGAVPETNQVLVTPLSGVPPFSLAASNQPFDVIVELQNGAELLIEDVVYPVIPPRLFGITEVNFDPVAGQSQWFEVENFSAQAIDLNGWYIDFGTGMHHTITGAPMLPGGGRLVFGQEPGSAEVVPVDYVYGTGTLTTVPASNGSLSIGLAGKDYTTATWTSASAPGVSQQIVTPGSAPSYVLFAANVTSLNCDSVTPYGTNGQLGTPGAPNNCIPWSVSSIPSDFIQLSTSGGTALITSTSVDSNDGTNIALNFVAAGGRAVKIGNKLYGDAALPLRVDANGWISLMNHSSTDHFSDPLPSSATPNGFIALYHDDLAGNGSTTPPSGVYWKQFDPNGTPGDQDDFTIISWENWRRYGNTSSLNFQLRILEYTGDVEIHYGTMTCSTAKNCNGAEATAWIESEDGKFAVKAFAKEPILQSNMAWRFTFIQ